MVPHLNEVISLFFILLSDWLIWEIGSCFLLIFINFFGKILFRKLYSILKLDIPLSLIYTFLYFIHFFHMCNFWFLTLIIILYRLNIVSTAHACIFYQIFAIWILFIWYLTEILSTFPSIVRLWWWSNLLWLFIIVVWHPTIIVCFWILAYILRYIMNWLIFNLYIFIKNFLLFLLELLIPLFFLISPYW